MKQTVNLDTAALAVLSILSFEYLQPNLRKQSSGMRVSGVVITKSDEATVTFGVVSPIFSFLNLLLANDKWLFT